MASTRSWLLTSRFILSRASMSTKAWTHPCLGPAMHILQRERDAIASRSTCSQQQQVETAYSDMSMHNEFKDKFHDILSFDPKPLDSIHPLYPALKQAYFDKVTVPKLMKSAQETGIVGDVFPCAIQPTLQVDLQWGPAGEGVLAAWKGAYGHPIPPQWSLYSPQVTLTSLEEEEKLYTLILSDLDHPNPSKGALEEFCHWHIANIPVKKRLVIPGGTSPCLKHAPEMPLVESIEPSLARVAKPPTTEPTLPGDVIFGYLPPHPAHSNPKLRRRFLLTLLEQDQRVDPVKLKQHIQQEAVERKQQQETSSVPSALSLFMEREEELEFHERASFLPTWKFTTQQQLTVRGYGIFHSSWNLFTPPIFTSLGIHEPVYGKIRKSNVKIFVEKTQKAVKVMSSALSETQPTTEQERVGELITKLADSTAMPYPLVTTRRFVSQAPIPTRLVDLVNLGHSPVVPTMAQPSRKAQAYIAQKEQELQQQQEKKASKKGSLKNAVEWRKSLKMPKLTTVAAVGLAKSRETLGSGSIVGPLSDSLIPKRSRYQNV